MAMRLSVRAAALFGLFALLLGLTIGLVLGYLLTLNQGTDAQNKGSPSAGDKPCGEKHASSWDSWVEEPELTKRILDEIEPDRIRDNLRYLSQEPHLAGTPRDEELANHIRNTWIDNGLDTSELVPYDILLSYANRKKPNRVQLISKDGTVMFTSSHKEKGLRAEDEHPNFIHAYHAYSPNGTVEADLIFANCGDAEDWDVLDQMNISVEHRIVLLKDGCLSTGQKVQMAQERGAAGVITYSDPMDVAAAGMDAKDVYPNSWWLPGTGIARSSVSVQLGDPMTPGYPSIDGVFRLPVKHSKLPQIPSQPISYNDANILLRRLGGNKVPQHWIGSLNVTYNTGPGFQGSYNNAKVRLTVNNHYRIVKSYNVIGTIRGSTESDRYVILGNHRDSWGFGAIDPGGGTAMMLELTRVLGNMHKDGWSPRRTMVFASWGAEEFALVGSTEWVEEKFPKLQSRAISYINTDVCVVGNRFTAMASPLIQEALFEVTKLIPDPENEAANLYDSWVKHSYSDDETEQPQVDKLGPYSDFASFIFFAGIPVMDISWQVAIENITGTIYPTYHTGYETFHIVEKYVDPSFRRHQSCGHVAGLMMRYLSDSAVLPFSVQRVKLSLMSLLETFKGMGIDDDLAEGNLPFDTLEQIIHNFNVTAAIWQESFDAMDRNDSLTVRMFNDQMMLLERAFIMAPRDPDHWFSRHRLYTSVTGLLDTLTLRDAMDSDEDVTLHWQEIHRHLSDLIIGIHQASQVLQPFSQI